MAWCVKTIFQTTDWTLSRKHGNYLKNTDLLPPISVQLTAVVNNTSVVDICTHSISLSTYWNYIHIEPERFSIQFQNNFSLISNNVSDICNIKKKAL